MNKKLTALLIALTISLSCTSIVFAQKTNLNSDSKETISAKSDAAKSSSSSDSTAGKAARNIGAFFVGIVVGAPIAMARMSYKESIVATRDLVGDTDNWALLAAGSVLGIPAGVLSGTTEGFLMSVKNSWVEPAFSKESFSLGDEI
jgi:hypothetical protein